MNKKSWIGRNCRFIHADFVEEYEKKPIRPMAHANKWVYKGLIEGVKIAPPVGKIPSYTCKIRLPSGKTLTVNSTRQYLRLLDG